MRARCTRTKEHKAYRLRIYCTGDPESFGEDISHVNFAESETVLYINVHGVLTDPASPSPYPALCKGQGSLDSVGIERSLRWRSSSFEDRTNR